MQPQSHNPSQEAQGIFFPQELQPPDQPLASPEMLAKGQDLQGCSCKVSFTLQGQGRETNMHPPSPRDLGTSAEGGKETERDFQKYWFSS